jgi:predicted metal-dependent peptidase
MGVGIDTSGSIGDELNNFLSELRSIAEDVQPEVIDLVYWDSAIASHEKYDRSMMGNLINSTKPKGGGGTSPSCVTDWLAREKIVPECFIMFTDGWVGSDWGGNWPCPVLWVVVGNKSASASTGITVHI